MKNRLDESFNTDTLRKALTGHTNTTINSNKIIVTNTGTIQPSNNSNSQNNNSEKK